MLAAASFGILIVTANGLLQEEALFGPLALALISLLAGLGIGRTAGSYSYSPSRREQQSAGARFNSLGRGPASAERIEASRAMRRSL